MLVICLYYIYINSNVYILFYKYIGSERTTDSIKNKIHRVMASYKEGHERLSQTGGGMDGIELTTFQEWVTTNICKYYFELDAVLKDRPNVKPWYTNEDVSVTENNDVEEEDSEGNMSISSTNDHESLRYIEQEFNTYDSDTEIETTDISPGTKDIEPTHEYETITNNSRPFDLSNHSRTNFSPTSDGNRSITMMSPSNTSSDEYATPTSSTPENKRKGNQLVTRNLSPIEARTMQRNLKKKKNKTIAKRKANVLRLNLLLWMMKTVKLW